MEKVEIGKITPDFEMPDMNGNLIKLSDLCNKADFLLLEFWGSTCGPYRKDHPNILKAYNKYRNKGFDILGVSLDTEKELWLKAIEQDGLKWTNVCSLAEWKDNSIVYNYALSQVHQNFLLGKNGKIMAKNIHGEELMQKLEDLIDNN